MPRVLYRRTDRDGVRPHIFIATPCYGGLDPAYAYALYGSALALERAGMAADLEILSGDCHVDDARNRLVRDFLATDCTDLVFIDADLRWDPEDLVRLCAYDRDIVAGIYPLKQAPEKFPCRLWPGEIWSDADGLIDVEAVPTGFLRIRREVLEALAERSEAFAGKADGPDTPRMPLIFERSLHDGMRWGGDYTFCRKALEAGYHIHIDPSMRFEHYGESVWSGSYGSFLRRANGIAMVEGLAEVTQGTAGVETLRSLIECWGNPEWSATPDLLSAVSLLAREAEGPVLECGSGLTTLVMAASTEHPVYALEHDPMWAQHTRAAISRHGLTNAHVIYAPLERITDHLSVDWYGLSGVELPERFALTLCDGPPRTTAGGRLGIVTLAERIRDGVVVLDDAEPAQTAHLSKVLGATFTPFGRFAVGRNEESDDGR